MISFIQSLISRILAAVGAFFAGLGYERAKTSDSAREATNAAEKTRQDIDIAVATGGDTERDRMRRKWTRK